MLTKFQNHIITNFPFLLKSRFFIAVSGGIDSMVLVHLFQQVGYPFAMLHCNFQLRGKESDDDMRFVMKYGDKYLIPWSVGHLDTKGYAKEMKVSIQVAARELRYDWFYEQLKEKGFDYILTAHHLDDSLETFLINFTRGSGLEGLTGIPEQNDKIIRPLLPFSRNEIEAYAQENKIAWREDSSNASDKYLRNKFRHNVIPILKEINPSLLASFENTLSHLKQTQSLAADASKSLYSKVVTKNENQISIDLLKLLKYENYKSYLFDWLQPFGFSDWSSVYDLIHAQSGKQVHSETHSLLKNRETLLLFSKQEISNDVVYWIQKEQNEVKIPLNLSFCNVDDISVQPTNVIFVDEERLIFPLEIRKWKEGDWFFPFGMNGKKKLSKFFKDEKFSLLDKSNTWLLCSDNQIVWVVGNRQDERFKVTETTTRILKINYTI